MKKYMMILMAAFMAYACADQEYDPAFQPYVGLNTTGLKNFAENGGSVKIPIIFGGEASNSAAFNITYEISGGAYGENYTVDGGSAASGTIAFPAGALDEGAVQYITIKGVPDFDTEDDVPLTIAIKSADREVRIGYPYKDSYSFVITDDDCAFEFVGDLDGTDITTVDVWEFEGEAAVSILETGTEGEYTIEGLGTDWLANIWGEEKTASVPITMTIAPGGKITIEDQYAFTTVYQGTNYDYHVVGSGQVNYCEGTVSITYDIVYADGVGGIPAEYGGSIAAYGFQNEVMETELFVATLTPIAADED